MTRKEFLKMCGILGVGIPLATTISSCDDNSLAPDGKVIIIGAGVAGMSAGYLLHQQGIDFEILEAASTYGGRVKTNKNFVDFPIPLGAEWLHVEKNLLTEIVNDSSVTINVPTTPYDLNVDYGLHEGEQITVQEVGFTIDQKFIGATWLTFYEDYILPSISNKITYNQVVQNIDYSGDQVKIQTASGEYITDKVIVTVPVKILQVGDITFTPELPNRKQNAIDEVTVWDGFKAFIEFSEKFYPAFVSFEITPETAGQKLYYNAAYGQNSNRHVMGLFAVGTPAQQLGAMSDSELKNFMLSELDGIFNNQATAKYVQHTSQNWNAEPYAKGGYIYDHESSQNITRLANSVDNKVYFAGDGYGFSDDWSSVHVAARSAKRAVEELV